MPDATSSFDNLPEREEALEPVDAFSVGGDNTLTYPLTLRDRTMINKQLKHRLHTADSSISRECSLYTLYNMTEANSEKAAPPLEKSTEARASLVSMVGALYALLLVIMSLAFEASVIITHNDRTIANYDPFYIYLYGVGLLFLGYAQAFLLTTGVWKVPASFSRRSSVNSYASSESFRILPDIPQLKKRKVTHAGPMAGSLYLRLGCIFFGIVGMIFHGLDLYSCVSSPRSCRPATMAATALGCTFVFVQMYFIFQNSKMIIHRFKNVARMGSMHLVATNLCVWIRLLVIEEFHVIQEVEAQETHHQELHFGKEKNDTLNGIDLLHALLNPHKNSVSGIPGDDGHDNAGAQCRQEFGVDCILGEFKSFMATCLIEYSILCAAVMFVLWQNIGYKTPAGSLKRRKQDFRVDCSSSTKGLFMGLLFVVCTIVIMIIFFVKIGLDADMEALWIFYISDSVLFVFSIGACAIGIQRMRKLRYVGAQASKVLLLDDILLFVSLFGQLTYCIFSLIAIDHFSLIACMLIAVRMLRMVEVLLQTVYILIGQRLVALTRDLQQEKPGREIVTFLLMVNLAQFLINTFESQKASVNPAMMEFYGKAAWNMIVHVTVPLTIFYRFHSTVCLGEIWKTAYRVKTHDSV